MHFDPKTAWNLVTCAVQGGDGFGGAQAAYTAPGPVADKDTAQQHAGISTRERGTGWVVIDGKSQAYAGVTLVIQGTRPGVDGSYS